MPVDNRNKRFSLIGFGSPVPRVLPDPDASFANANDRAMLEYLYHGTLTAAVTALREVLFKGMFRGMFRDMR